MKRHRGWGKAVNRQPLFRLCVGVDWASQVHTISILEGNRKELENKAYPHTGAGLHQLANPFVELSVGPPRSTPNRQMDRFRDRHSVSGAKDHRRDAYRIADALATDVHKFHRVKRSEAAIVSIATFRKCSHYARASMNPGSGTCSKKRLCRSKPPSYRRRRSSELCPLIAFGESTG